MVSPHHRFRVQSRFFYTEGEVVELCRRLDAAGIHHDRDDADARGPGVVVGWRDKDRAQDLAAALDSERAEREAAEHIAFRTRLDEQVASMRSGRWWALAAGLALGAVLIGGFEWAAASGSRKAVAVAGCVILLTMAGFRVYLGILSGEPVWPGAWYRWRERRRRNRG